VLRDARIHRRQTEEQNPKMRTGKKKRFRLTRMRQKKSAEETKEKQANSERIGLEMVLGQKGEFQNLVRTKHSRTTEEGIYMRHMYQTIRVT
jgi:hypothetical protein